MSFKLKIIEQIVKIIYLVIEILINLKELV
ncbi:Uncharacterised protein [Campylobacter lari]|nr:Uncharacterised protein [Campylobacter lari]